MDERHCPECAASLASPHSRFCDQCGAAIPPPPQPQALVPASSATVPSQPPGVPGAPPESSGRRPSPRLLGPIVAAVAGVALLIAGFVSAAGGGDAIVSDALSASGAVDRPVVEAPAEVPVQQNPVDDRTANHNPTPTSTPPTTAPPGPGWENWPVALFTSFDDDVKWAYGVTGNAFRDFTGDTYTVSVTAGSIHVYTPTWQIGYRPEADFRLAVDTVSSTGSAACGLVAGDEDLPALFFLTDSVAGDYFVTSFLTSDSPETVVDGARPVAVKVETVGVNHLALLREGDTITVFSNGTPLATFVQPDFDIVDLGLAAYAPADSGQAVCEFDNFEIRWP